MDLTGDLSSLFSIKIILLPLGEHPHRCEPYMVKIRRFKVLEASGLHFTPSKDSPFARWSTLKSRVQLRFCGPQDVTRSDWNEFHIHRKPFAVVGVAHCPSANNDLAKIYDMFEAVKKDEMFESALRFQCYAFEPTGEEKATYSDMILFPNQDVEHTNFYITTILSDLVSLVLKDVEKTLIDALKSKETAFLTPVDNKQAGISQNRRVMQPRKLKIAGDYCLLVGCVTDAKKYYREALEPAKQNGDWVWAGGIMEGKAACHMLERAGEKVAMDCLKEALRFYRKVQGLQRLRVSAALKIAGLCVSLALRGDSFHRYQAFDYLRSLSILAVELTATEQVRVAIEAACIASTLGHYRSAALYIHWASVMSEELQNFLQAHHMLKLCAHGLDILAKPSHEVNEWDQKGEDLTGRSKRLTLSSSGLSRGWIWPDINSHHLLKHPEGKEPTPRKKSGSRRLTFPARIREFGWSDTYAQMLHLSLLNMVTPVSRPLVNMNPNKAKLLGLSFGLMLHPPYLSRLHSEVQRTIAERLYYLNTTTTTQRLLPTSGIIQVVQVLPQKLNDTLEPQELVAEDKKGVFVFAPESKASRSLKASRVRYVSGEPVDIVIRVRNLLRVAISIDTLRILANKQFHTYPATWQVPPLSEHNLVVSGEPRDSGTFTIHGVRLGFLGGEVNHMIDANGYGPITLSQAESRKSTHMCPRVLVREIFVSPPLPKALIEVSGAEAGAPEGLLQGEKARFWMHIRNVCVIPIERAHLEINLLFDRKSEEAQNMYYGGSRRATTMREFKAQRRPAEQKGNTNVKGVGDDVGGKEEDRGNEDIMVLWDDTEIPGLLPLNPRSETKVPIDVIGHTACCGIEISMRYSAKTGAKFERKLTTVVKWKVTRPLIIQSALFFTPLYRTGLFPLGSGVDGAKIGDERRERERARGRVAGSRT